MDRRLTLVSLGTIATLAGLYFAWPHLIAGIRQPLVGNWDIDSDPGVQLLTTRDDEKQRLAIGSGGVLFEYASPETVTKATFALHDDTDGVPGQSGTESLIMRTSVTSSSSADRMASGLGSWSPTYVLSGSLERSERPVDRRVSASIAFPTTAGSWSELAWLGDLQTTFRWRAVGNLLTIRAEGQPAGVAGSIAGLMSGSSNAILVGKPTSDGAWELNLPTASLPTGMRLVRLTGTVEAAGTTWIISFHGS
ncbi:MAG: hypothetical protein IPK26_18060 [Planctomycetes bacterium]|nr:hypothetical protein [Planctomycetota bacterium]